MTIPDLPAFSRSISKPDSLELAPAVTGREAADQTKSRYFSFVSGQSPWDAPRDRFLFALFSSGWVDSDGVCLPGCTWPSVTSFQAEKSEIENFLRTFNPSIECELRDKRVCSGTVNIALLFTYLKRKHPAATIFLVGSHLHEIEHRNGWSLKNLENLIQGVPESLVEEVKERSSSDSDWRFYPDSPSSEVTKRMSIEATHYLTHCIYWDPKNRSLRAEKDRECQPHDSSNPLWLEAVIQDSTGIAEPQWIEIWKAICDNGLLKFKSYDSAKNDMYPRTAYTTVSLGGDSKPLDLLFIEELARSCLFSFDDSHWRVGSLYPESSEKKAMDLWQHLIAQYSYRLQGSNYETYDKNAYIKYLSHMCKGARSPDPALEKALLKKVPLETLPELLADFHLKHSGTPGFVQALALRTLFSLKEQNCTPNDLSLFWEKICPNLPKSTPTLAGLVIVALSRPDISFDLIYSLLHVLSFLNLAAPNAASRTKFHLYFQKQKAIFEIAEEFSLSTGGEVRTSFELLRHLVADVRNPDSIDALAQIIHYLLPRAPFQVEQDTALKFYAKDLELDGRLIPISERLVAEESPLLQVLGFHLSFCCETVPSLPSLITYLFQHAKERHLLCQSLINSLKDTPKNSLINGLVQFQLTGHLDVLVEEANATHLEDISQIVGRINHRDLRLKLLKKLAYFSPAQAVVLFLEIEASLKNPIWNEYAALIWKGLAAHPSDSAIERFLSFLAEKPVKKDKKKTHPFREFFLSLLPKINGPAAASLTLSAIEKRILPHQEQKVAELFESTFTNLANKAAKDFWETHEKKIESYFPAGRHIRLTLAIAEHLKKLSILQNLNPGQLKNGEKIVFHNLVAQKLYSHLSQKNVSKADKVLKKFSDSLSQKELFDAHTIRLQLLLEAKEWSQAVDAIKKLLPQPALPDLVKLLKAVCGTDDHGRLLYQLLTMQGVSSFLKKHAVSVLYTHLCLCLAEEKRTNLEKMALVTILLENVDRRDIKHLADEQAHYFFSHACALLELLTIDGLPKELLQEKATFLIRITETPEDALRFLHGCVLRNLTPLLKRRTWMRIYAQILTQMTQENNLETIHQILQHFKSKLPLHARLNAITSQLVDHFLKSRQGAKANLWVTESLKQEIYSIDWIRPLLDLNCTAPVLIILEKVQKNPKIMEAVRPLLKHPAIPPAKRLPLLLHYRYPVNSLWAETLEAIHDYNPLFLSALQQDAALLQEFQQEPILFARCLAHVMHTLSRSGHHDLLRIINDFSFWDSQITPFSGSSRIALLNSLLEGVLKVLPVSEELEPLIWRIDERLNVILMYTPERELSPPTGLGHVKTIAEIFIRSDTALSSQKACARVLQAAQTKIDEDGFHADCKKELIRITHLLCSMHKKTELAAFIQFYADYPLLFSFQELAQVLDLLTTHATLAWTDSAFNLIKEMLSIIEMRPENIVALKTFTFAQALSTIYSKMHPSPLLNLKELYEHTLFTSSSAWGSANLFLSLISIHTNYLEVLGDRHEIHETLLLLLARLERLLPYRDLKLRACQIGIKLLLSELKKSKGGESEALFLYLSLMRITFKMPPLAIKPLPLEIPFGFADAHCFRLYNYIAYTNFIMEEDPASIDISPKEGYLHVDPCLFAMLQSPQDPEAFFQAFSEFLDTLLKDSFPSHRHSFLLELVWEHLIYFCEYYPSRSPKILELMERAIFTDWIATEKDCVHYLNLVNLCVAIGLKKGFFAKKPDKLLLFRLYLQQTIFLCIVGNPLSAPPFETRLNIANERVAADVVSLIGSLIETKNCFQTARALLLIIDLHTINFVYGQHAHFNPRHSPQVMEKIYEDLIEQIGENPFFSMRDYAQEKNPDKSGSNFPEPLKQYAVYQLTLLFSQNGYFLIPSPGWKRVYLSIFTKWAKTLLTLHKAYLEKEGGTIAFYCLVKFLTKALKDDLFKDNFPAYLALLEEISSHCILRFQNPQLPKIAITHLFTCEVDGEANKLRLQAFFQAFLSKIPSKNS